MPNVGAIIEDKNKKKMQLDESKSVGKPHSCLRNTKCPLQEKYLSRDIMFIYHATVKCEDNEETYFGLTVQDFKSRLANHKASLKTKSKQNDTQLSKYVTFGI